MKIIDTSLHLCFAWVNFRLSFRMISLLISFINESITVHINYVNIFRPSKLETGLKFNRLKEEGFRLPRVYINLPSLFGCLHRL